MGASMHVVFIVPAPFVKRNPIYRLGGRLYGHSNPITGPLILGGIVRQAGHDVECYQELHGPVDYKRLLKWADVVGVYAMTATAPRAYEIADLFHEKGHAHVLIGGIHPSSVPEEALTHADQVIVGEGESVILDAVEGRRTEEIVRAEPVCNLDDVPFPDYSILKTPCESANIMTSRGCPFNCTFCTTSRMFAPYRKRSVDSVIAEIRMAHEQGFEYMNFEDDNFTADKERAKKICQRIIDEGLQFKETFFFGRTDMARDPELLDLLAKAHLTRVLIGIESLNQESLDSIDKHQSIADIERAGTACRKHGIRVIASIVLGIDTDGPEDIERSYRFAKSIGAYQIQPAILTPFPGTPDYERLRAEGRIFANDWELFDMTNVTFHPKKMSPWRLQECFFEAADQFYDFKSALDIWRTFGAEYGLRRIYLAIATTLGVPLAHFCADHVKASPYYQLKHMDWLYGPQPLRAGSPKAARGVSGRSPGVCHL
ncbi:B12-binding domain-containing radical SAM protein [Olsenella sp. Marseille-P4559]|uniref:B12-binding domain-containing radical SAM protein n=1 Tax=Olsenella sp. Marseille-P4559 TaxID=2364795 RepID=UPI001A92EB62|nr:radical SAM protein [Olsenella sp. Marseille-P4559]